MGSARLVGLLLAAMAILAPVSGRADGRFFQSEEIGPTDVVARALTVDDRWRAGLIRFEVTLAHGGAVAGPWHIVLRGDGGQTVPVAAAEARSRIVATESGRFYLDLPVPSWRTLQVVASAPILSVIAVEVLYPSLEQALQRLPDSHVDYFDRDVGLSEKSFAGAFGRLDVTGIDSNDPRKRVCTAFRVKKGLWLTAAHCVTRDPKLPDAEAMWIQPLKYADKDEPIGRLSARVLATGQKNGEWRPDEVLRNDELDFALLSVVGDPGGPAFALGAPPSPGPTALQLLMHWSGNPAGKARSAGPGCRIQSLSGTDSKTKPDHCYLAIRHGCTSDDGASGAVLVPYGAPQSFVGLNYRGGLFEQFNCAVPAPSIHRFLCQTKSQFGKELSPCPL